MTPKFRKTEPSRWLSTTPFKIDHHNKEFSSTRKEGEPYAGHVSDVEKKLYRPRDTRKDISNQEFITMIPSNKHDLEKLSEICKLSIGKFEEIKTQYS